MTSVLELTHQSLYDFIRRCWDSPLNLFLFSSDSSRHCRAVSDSEEGHSDVALDRGGLKVFWTHIKVVLYDVLSN